MIQLKETYKKGSNWLPPIVAFLNGFVSRKSFFYLLLGIAVLILSANLGLPPLSGSEGRWAVIARSMLRTGDLLSPTLFLPNYWDKPLLSYWQILPLSYLNGEVSEFTVRVPSIVWAMAMLLLTHSLARRWLGEQTALLSVGILATSHAFVIWGRDAQVEMTNAAMILLCLWYFLKHKTDNRYTWVYVLGIMMAPLCCSHFLHHAFVYYKKGMVMDTSFKNLGHGRLTFPCCVHYFARNNQYSFRHMGTFIWGLEGECFEILWGIRSQRSLLCIFFQDILPSCTLVINIASCHYTLFSEGSQPPISNPRASHSIRRHIPLLYPLRIKAPLLFASCPAFRRHFGRGCT
jgi:hypothetical protein